MADRPERIVLVGMMGSGKTTVGRALAVRLGWPLLDNDVQVRALTGRDGPTLFRESGEEVLHAAERAALEQALDHGSSPVIVTAAASVVDDPAVRDRLRDAGHVVWLRADPATLHHRIGAGRGRRADAVDERWLAELAHDRETRYREVADQVVDVDQKRVSTVVDEVVAGMG